MSSAIFSTSGDGTARGVARAGLVVYGVDAGRLELSLERDPEDFLDDLLADEADWFDARDRRHAALIASGAPDARACARQLLCGELLDARAAPLYSHVTELLYQYAGQRLEDDLFQPLDDELWDMLGRWLGVLDAPLYLDELLEGEGPLVIPRAGARLMGWLDEGRCDELDAFFCELDPQLRWEAMEEVQCWREGELDAMARQLEGWLTSCAGRGWCLATFL